MSTPATLPPTHVHGDSLRIGIRLACVVYTGALPPDDMVKRVVVSKPANIVVNEFSLDMLTTVSREKSEHRRICAMRAMEVMLHHAGEPSLMTDEGLENIASKAWRLATLMDSEEKVSLLVDTLAEKKA